MASAVLVGLLACGGMVLRGTEAVFTANTGNTANAWASATLAIADNRSGTAMFTTAGQGPLVPSASFSRCITVTYSGTALSPATNATVKLFVSASTGTSAGNLGDYLDLTVSESTDTNAAADCSGFGTGTPLAGVGTLSQLAAKNSFALGVGAWSPTAASKVRSYKFTVTMKSTTPSALQGATATAAFTWEAQAGT